MKGEILLALAKRAASLAELIAAGALIVGLLQMEVIALAVGVFFMALTFVITWSVDLCEKGTK